MLALKRRLLSTTFLPLMVGMGVVLAAGSSSDLSAQSENPCAAKKPVAGKAPCNPCAAGAAAPCNPCAATGAATDRTYTIREGDSLAGVAQRTYGDPALYRRLADYNGIADPDLIVVGQVIRIPANPCAAQKVAAAANPCNPCNPCAAKGAAGASDCVVPRLQTAAAQNPCAATKPANPCNPCNPCAAANPCNPCAAKTPCAANPCAAASPCNPCAAAANPCNPCNPCAAAEAVELTPDEATAAYECIKGVMRAAYTGQTQQAAANPCNPCAAASPCNPCAAAANPCNPCAATKAASPCNPCAATKAASPCNPCAVKKPSNPCAVNPCNPCAAKNPCKPGAANTPCNPAMIQAAAVAGMAATIAQDYQGWERLNTAPYVSATHGSRYVNNYPGPEAAEAYGQFEEIGAMPAGGRIAKDSFTVSPDGRVAVGPLFSMEKMPEGFNPASADWRYAMIMPDGSLFGVTNGQGSQNVQFCAECHAIVADTQDSLYFMPEEYRVSAN
jgi:LysM repeat protein